MNTHDFWLDKITRESRFTLVSLAAVFWMSRNAPPKFRDIQNTAAAETSFTPDLRHLRQDKFALGW